MQLQQKAMPLKMAVALVGGFLCLSIVQAVNEATPSDGCPSGWRQFGQSCYKMVTNTPLKWDKARQVCLDAGSELAVPKSKSENDFIWDLQKELIPESTNPHNMWLGCRYDNATSDQLQFVDIFKNDYKNVPLDHLETGCCNMRHQSGDWALVSCDKSRNILCEQKRCSLPLRCFAVTHQDQLYCLHGHTFKETTIQNPIECCLACSKDPNCRSFNLSGKACQLNNATISQVNAGDNLMENCVYYEYE